MPGSNMNLAEQESLGSIQTRVTHLEQGLSALDKNMREGFAGITSQIREQRTPPYQLYGLILAIALAFSGMVGWVITDRQNTAFMQVNKAADTLGALIVKMDDQKVGKAEFSITQERGKESRLQLNDDIKRGDTELQRQIDELKRQQGDTYSLRDAFMEAKQEIKELKEFYFKGRAP